MCVKERELWKEKCTKKPFSDFLWCDGNSRTLHGYATVKQSDKPTKTKYKYKY